MSDSRPSLADPSFEPSDEDLIGLATRAFAHVRAEQEDMLRKLRSEIAAARVSAFQRFRDRKLKTKADR